MMVERLVVKVAIVSIDKSQASSDSRATINRNMCKFRLLAIVSLHCRSTVAGCSRLVDRHYCDLYDQSLDLLATAFLDALLARTISESRSKSPKMLRFWSRMVARPICRLCDPGLRLLNALNDLQTSRQFPDAWGKEVKLPTLKPGKDPLQPESYRPISLTSCLCKLLERMVNHRFMWFLEKNNILCP